MILSEVGAIQPQSTRRSRVDMTHSKSQICSDSRPSLDDIRTIFTSDGLRLELGCFSACLFLDLPSGTWYEHDAFWALAQRAWYRNPVDVEREQGVDYGCLIFDADDAVTLVRYRVGVVVVYQGDQIAGLVMSYAEPF